MMKSSKNMMKSSKNMMENSKVSTKVQNRIIFKKIFGGPAAIRTQDLTVISRALHQAKLRAQLKINEVVKPENSPEKGLSNYGGPAAIRTQDLTVISRALHQAKLRAQMSVFLKLPK